jgi:type I restriction enzyme R subunit
MQGVSEHIRTKSRREELAKRFKNPKDAFRLVIDIFAAAWLKKPGISILSDEFMAEVPEIRRRISRWSCCGSCSKGRSRRGRRRTSCRRDRSPRCSKALGKYRNRAIETAAVVEEMIALAKEMREANARRGTRAAGG